MRELPKVVITGRMNVGKSTLFNRLSTNVKSLTMDYEGVTRDFVTDVVCWQDVCFELIDSGGISLKKAEDPLAERVRTIALRLLEDASIILFVVDGTIGISTRDRELAKFLHKLGKPVLLVVNKIDSQRAQEMQYEFEQFGFKQPYFISAQHGQGIAELLDGILEMLPKKLLEAKEEEEPKLTVTLLGKPNVGKSSLLNTLLERERVLVTDMPGTTREAISAQIRFYQENITITDTPGIRRKRAVEEPLEKLMVKSALRAVKNSDIILLLIDGSEGYISDQELKLAFYAFQEGKAFILLINKEDLMDEQMHEALKDQMSRYKHLFDNIPQLYISCKTKKNVGKILPLINEVWQRYNQSFSVDELTTFFKDALHKTPLYHTGQLLKVKQVKQIRTAPPTLLMRVNHPQWFGESQLSFFENRMRKKYELKGIPIIFVVRKS
jgi:GTPase